MPNEFLLNVLFVTCTCSVYYRRGTKFHKKKNKKKKKKILSRRADCLLRKARNLFRASTDGTHARADFRFPIKSLSVYRVSVRVHRDARVHVPRFRMKSDSRRCCEKHPKAYNNKFVSRNLTTASLIISVQFRNIYEVITSPVSIIFQFPLRRDESARIYCILQRKEYFPLAFLLTTFFVRDRTLPNLIKVTKPQRDLLAGGLLNNFMKLTLSFKLLPPTDSGLRYMLAWQEIRTIKIIVLVSHLFFSLFYIYVNYNRGIKNSVCLYEGNNNFTNKENVMGKYRGRDNDEKVQR
ncbi:hypothetical protein PUN28_010975 [Cardiocondyla obscurior]|uniref:Uncharacterized protein n=1 Tax=Cardiocondyla obscurior TaxID=286306 RepID=A0AAW2FJ01_9HYME